MNSYEKAQRPLTPTSMYTLLGVLTITGGLGITGLVCLNAASSYGTEIERQLIAQRKNTADLRAVYAQRVVEVSGLSGTHADALAILAADRNDLVDATRAREWLKANGDEIGVKEYNKIYLIIESGHAQAQTAKEVRANMIKPYKETLGTLWKGLWLKLAGFPKIDLES